MKKCFLAVLMLVFLAACGGNGAYTPTEPEDVVPAIVGRWEAVTVVQVSDEEMVLTRFEDHGITAFTEFLEDGTGMHSSQENNEPIVITNFTWTTANGTVHFIHVDPPSYESLVYEVNALNTTLTTTHEFTIGFPDGSVRYVTQITTFHRVD